MGVLNPICLCFGVVASAAAPCGGTMFEGSTDCDKPACVVLQVSNTTAPDACCAKCFGNAELENYAARPIEESDCESMSSSSSARSGKGAKRQKSQ